MDLYGERGTGSPRVIQTITKSFAARGTAHALARVAHMYTGATAPMTHLIASLSLGWKGSVTDASKKKLRDFRRNIRYLRVIIDEYSALSKTFLATLSGTSASA